MAGKYWSAAIVPTIGASTEGSAQMNSTSTPAAWAPPICAEKSESPTAYVAS